jgi:hypothetical protein
LPPQLVEMTPARGPACDPEPCRALAFLAGRRTWSTQGVKGRRRDRLALAPLSELSENSSVPREESNLRLAV